MSDAKEPTGASGDSHHPSEAAGLRAKKVTAPSAPRKIAAARPKKVAAPSGPTKDLPGAAKSGARSAPTTPEATDPTGPPPTPPPDEDTETQEEGHVEVAATSYPSEVWLRRIDGVRRVLPRWVYFWLVASVSRRIGDEWHWRNADDRDNERGIPPADEHVRWHALWIAEVYLPSTIGALVDGIEDLGWWESRRDENVRVAINAGRSGRGGGSVVLPLLHRRTGRGVFRMTSWDRELPPGVEYVTGHVYYLTPSATVLIVGFRFADSVSAEVELALRGRYKTFHKRTGWYRSRVMTPDSQRRDAVRAIERRLIRDGRAWLSARMPGYFAADPQSTGPATLLVTTEKAVPFVRSKEDQWWMSQAGIEYAWERWTTGIKDLLLNFRPGDDGAALLAGRRSDIFSDADYWKGFGHDDPMWSLQYEVDTDLTEVFALLALDDVLRDGRQRLGRLRDSLSTISSTSSSEQLESVKSQLGTMSSDLTSLIDEVERWPEERAFVLRNIPDMRPVGKGEETKALGDRLVDWYAEEGRRVRAFEGTTRSLLVATAEIAAALENLKLQSFVKWVSVLALVVALVALAVTGAGVAHDLGWLPGPTPSPSP